MAPDCVAPARVVLSRVALIGLALIWLAPAPVTAGPAPMSAGRLGDLCAVLERHGVQEVPARAAEAVTLCVGYLSGALDALEAPPAPRGCRPAAASLQQVAEAYLAQLRRQRQRLGEPAVRLLGELLDETWPCR